jgi:hypothetical protein
MTGFATQSLTFHDNFKKIYFLFSLMKMMQTGLQNPSGSGKLPCQTDHRSSVLVDC